TSGGDDVQQYPG
ncbi:phage capsid scaffolding family protein, partial [Escherichia coli EC1865]